MEASGTPLLLGVEMSLHWLRPCWEARAVRSWVPGGVERCPSLLLPGQGGQFPESLLESEEEVASCHQRVEDKGTRRGWQTRPRQGPGHLGSVLALPSRTKGPWACHFTSWSLCPHEQNEGINAMLSVPFLPLLMISDLTRQRKEIFEGPGKEGLGAWRAEQETAVAAWQPGQRTGSAVCVPRKCSETTQHTSGPQGPTVQRPPPGRAPCPAHSHPQPPPPRV